MDLFTYLMAKKGHNTHRDLFSYLLGKNAGGSGTYTTFSGISLNISNTLQAKIKNIALEGNASQDGEPTPDTPIPIKVVTGEQSVDIIGKNLFDKSKITELSTYRSTATINNDKSITITSTASNGYAIIRPFFNFKANRTYTISFDVDDVSKFNHMYLFVSTSATAGGYSKNPYVTITRTEDVSLGIGIYPNTNETITISNIQIEENSVRTSFEPYQSQNYPLSLGNIELFRSYTDDTRIYTDYIFKNEIGNPYYNSSLDESSWYKYNRNRKVELKDYNYTTSVTKRTDTILFLGNVSGKANSRYYCNILSSYHYNTLINSDIEGIGHGGGYANRLYISVNKNRLEGYTEDLTNSQLNTLLKQFFENSNAYAWYALSTPTYDKITDTTLISQLENLNKARSYKDTTIIECTSESTDNETIVFSGDIKVTSVGLGNSLNTSLLSNNIQEEPNVDDVNEIEETLSLDNEIKDEVSE